MLVVVKPAHALITIPNKETSQAGNVIGRIRITEAMEAIMTAYAAILAKSFGVLLLMRAASILNILSILFF